MSMTENEYFNIINDISKDKNIKNKPIFNYERDKDGNINITAKRDDNIIQNDDIDFNILDNLIEEYIILSKRINIEIKMNTILYNDTKKEIYNNQVKSLKQKLVDINLKIKALNKIKGENNG